MIYGSKEDGSATITLSKEEHERFKAGNIIKKRTGCKDGLYDISLQLKYVKPLPKEYRGSDECHCGRKLKTFMHGCDERTDLVEMTGCPYCDDRCPMCANESEE